MTTRGSRFEYRKIPQMSTATASNKFRGGGRGGRPGPVFDKGFQSANSCEDIRAARQLWTYLEAN
jgi:hypothetical protein